MRVHLSFAALLLAASCTAAGPGSGIFGSGDPAGSDAVPQTVPQQRPTTDDGIEIGGAGQSADALDQTSDGEKQAALQTTQGGAFLGQTVASLGDPGEPGFWLKTPLVDAETDGRIEAEDGTSLALTLIPISAEAGSGSEISLAAMRALGLSLTDLPNIRVFQ